jgi:hypothetical protein
MNFQNLALDPTTLIETNFQQLLAHTDWRTTWTQIVSGKFSTSPYSGLLFYSQSQGYGEFYETNGFGGIAFLQSHSGWRTSWTHIVPGVFHSTEFTGLLFYDQQAGFAAIYDTDGKGGITEVHQFTGWRTSWTHITTVRIPNSDFSGVVLYDQAAGHLEIHRCDGNGGLKLIIEKDGWGTGWTQVVGDPTSGTGILFYDGSTHYGIACSVVQVGTHPFALTFPTIQIDLPPATQIVAGNFGAEDNGFLFYDAVSGQLAFVFYLPPTAQDTTPVTYLPGLLFTGSESYSGFRTTWDLIVPGQFWEADPETTKFQDGFTDLLFYDRGQGYSEFYLHEPFNSILVNPLEGYTSPGSVYPGGNLRIFVNSRIGPYAINIFRQDVDQVFMSAVQNIQSYSQAFPISRLDYRDGPAWPAVAEFVIPQDWPSGLYFVRVTAGVVVNPPPPYPDERSLSVGQEPGYLLNIPFVVRSGNPGGQSRILVMLPDTTYAAYNFWGGRSLYGFQSSIVPMEGPYGRIVWSYGSPLDGDPSNGPDNHQTPRAFRIALERPYNNIPPVGGVPAGLPKWQVWEVPLIRWLARQQVPVEWCLSTDIHRDQVENTNLLRNYKLVVSLGHDEYWSAEMRENVQGFVEAGGNAVFFSGNVCWWQIRFDPEGKTQTCYKDSRFDPESNPKLVTVNWYAKPVCTPETSLTGVSLYDPLAPNASGYSVVKPDHWVFANTGLSMGQQFGTYGDPAQSLFLYENDRYQKPQGNPCIPSSPSNFLTLAQAPAKPATAAVTMGIFTNKKGQVFTVGTTNWTLGLSQDGGWTAVDQITRNVFDQLG